MKSDSSSPVVVCADAIVALYPTGRMTLKAIAICGPFVLLGWLLKLAWPNLIGITLVGGLLIVPHFQRFYRFIHSLPCAACGLAAGRSTTVKSILHLQCTHCGHLSRTDCMFFGPGRPTKV